MMTKGFLLVDAISREEAIADIRDNIKPVVGGKSLDMAIEALEQEPCDDVISRQAVLEGVNRYIKKAQSTGTKDDFISFEELVVKELPSVKPQEPFMNKPCVAHQVCHEDKVKILDKIRAEIVELPTISINANDVYKAQVLQIIDKYKAESEDKE